MRSPSALAFALAFALSGCVWVPGGGWDWEWRVGPVDTNTPPRLELELTQWPPLGKGSTLDLNVADDEGLMSAEVSFTRARFFPLSGTAQALRVPATELGEGYGTLAIVIRDANGRGIRHEQTGLLVDLSDPALYLEHEILRTDGRGPNSALSLIVGDAWVLGTVEVTLGEEVRTHTFPPVFPSTFGKDWDLSYLSFDASTFPAGPQTVKVTVTDAAGNRISEDLQIVVDANPPAARVEAQFDSVRRAVRVEVEATDAEGPAHADLFASGQLVATVNGPTAVVELGADDFPPGPLQLVAIARDAAGYETTSAPVVITLE